MVASLGASARPDPPAAPSVAIGGVCAAPGVVVSPGESAASGVLVSLGVPVGRGVVASLGASARPDPPA
ncbi:hypothetical protein ACOZE4_13845, partial [Streptomyces griseoincarnatus]